jgi:hypothetical protein
MEKCCSTINVVVFGLGIALVVFFAGATAAIAAGHTPPTALWAAGGAVSGGLIGLLAPSPGAKKRHEDAAAAAESLLRNAHAEADREGAQRAAATALEHRTAAADPEIPVIGLLVIFAALLALSVILATGEVFNPPKTFVGPMKNLTTAVVALTSAAGSALIGVYAPTPSRSNQ